MRYEVGSKRYEVWVGGKRNQVRSKRHEVLGMR